MSDEMSDEMIDEPMDENLIQKEKRWEYIRSYLQKNGSVRNAEICQVLGLSSSTANRLLRTWVYEKKLERYRDGRTWAYRLKWAPHKILCKQTPNQTSPACQA